MDLSARGYVVLARQGGHDSHVLLWGSAGWRYGERTCHSDTCQCVTHDRWHWQPCTEDEAGQIVAAFEAKGFIRATEAGTGADDAAPAGEDSEERTEDNGEA